MSIIKVINLKKSYGKKGRLVEAVSGISFAVEQGEIFGILGPNGAGKTTTLEILEGLKLPSSGEVEILGLPLSSRLSQIKKEIGVQLQSNGYFPYLTLKELLGLFASFYGQRPDTDRLLGFVGLNHKKDELIKNLSGGQRQRFSIAASLVHRPKILFFDEPTTGLDPKSRRDLWGLIQQINRDGVTVVMTTHYMEEAEYLCHRVAIMDQGKILKIKAPKELIDEISQTTQVSFMLAARLDDGIWSNIREIEKIYNNFPKLTIEIKTLECIPKILEILRQRKIGFSGFTVRTASLEDVYLDLTGKEYFADGTE